MLRRSLGSGRVEVRATGFEPATCGSQSRRSTKLSYALFNDRTWIVRRARPVFFGDRWKTSFPRVRPPSLRPGFDLNRNDDFVVE